MTGRFADRVAPDTYQDDEPWAVGLVGAGRAVDWASTLPDEHTGIPEGIAERLLALGRAYRLHQLSALDGTKQNRLNVQQAASLAEEVAFLARVVNDPALREHRVVAAGKPMVAPSEGLVEVNKADCAARWVPPR